MFPEVTGSDRYWMRVNWLKVQGRKCAVCEVAFRGKSPYGHGWVLDYQSDHGKPYCWNCVTGVTCRLCMLHLRHYRSHRGNLPRQDVNGMDPYEWGRRASRHLDLGVCSGGQARSEAEEVPGP